MAYRTPSLTEIPEDLADLEYLRQINHQENPDQRTRFEGLLEQGYSPEDFVLLSDELGRVRYPHKKDPDAPRNRFTFIDPTDFNTLPPPISGAAVSYYDKRYYSPETVERIHSTRALVSRALHAEEQQKTLISRPLETHEEYLDYFKKFHPNIIREFIRNLHYLELTEGCNGPCRAICAADAKNKAMRHIPFKTVLWLFETYEQEFRDLIKQGTPPMLYYGSDLPDYKDGDKTALDVCLWYEKLFDQCPNISISYRLDKAGIDFLYHLVVTLGFPINRISRLTSGRADDAPEKLLTQLRKKALDNDTVFTESMERHIRKALVVGKKREDMNTRLGNAVTHNTSERNISTSQIACAHGVGIRAGYGFFGHVLEPPTRLFPYGEIIFPLVPDRFRKVKFPQLTRSVNQSAPHRNDNRSVVLRPLFTVIDNSTGIVTEKESLTQNEQALIAINMIKRSLYLFNNFLLAANPHGNGNMEPCIRIICQNIRSRKDKISDTETAEYLEWLEIHAENLHKGFILLTEKIDEALRNYGDDTGIRCQLATIEFRTQCLLIDELRHIQIFYKLLKIPLNEEVSNNLIRIVEMIEKRKTKKEEIMRDGGKEARRLQRKLTIQNFLQTHTAALRAAVRLY